MSNYDKPNRIVFKHAHKSCMQKFNNAANDILDNIKLQKRVLELAYSNSNSNKSFYAINNIFTEILNKVRAVVEGQKRALSFSQRKLEISNEHLCWKL